METTVRIIAIVLSSLFFLLVIRMLVKQNLSESKSVFWLFVAVFTLLAGIFPVMITHIARFLGIDYPPTFIFLGGTILLLAISFKHTIDMSKAEARYIELSVALSILKEENKQLTEHVNEIKNTILEKQEENNR